MPGAVGPAALLFQAPCTSGFWPGGTSGPDVGSVVHLGPFKGASDSQPCTRCLGASLPVTCADGNSKSRRTTAGVHIHIGTCGVWGA